MCNENNVCTKNHMLSHFHKNKDRTAFNHLRTKYKTGTLNLGTNIPKQKSIEIHNIPRAHHQKIIIWNAVLQC